MTDNINQVHESFTRQAETFNATPMNVQRQEHMNHIIDLLSPLGAQSVLEVAAGTCACGRTFAQTASAVTCLDTTAKMLEVGLREAKKSALSNMVFVQGDAGQLPFLDESFDITFCRLAFHHIPEYEKPFAEMARVLRPGGLQVLVDLVAPKGPAKAVKEEMEIARDPSHAKTLSEEEMLSLFEQEHLEIKTKEETRLEVSLKDWFDVTQPAAEVVSEITGKLQAEIDGGTETGFEPFVRDGEIFFYQHWLLVIGKKSRSSSSLLRSPECENQQDNV